MPHIYRHGVATVLFLTCGRLLFPALQQPSFACNVPVFRYAMERWPADPYQLIVYHHGAPTPEFRQMLDSIAEGEQVAANVHLEIRDIKTIEGPEGISSNVKAPWMVLKYPRIAGIESEIWSGPFTKSNVNRVLTSPVRVELARRLLEGEAAVWLYLEGQDGIEGEKTARFLGEQLQVMSSELKCPQTGIDIYGNPLQANDSMDGDVKFSMIRFSQDDPDEEILVKILLGSEWDLATYKAPIAFPVFGRARALYALVGTGISQRTILNTCQFLVGWCSCEIKYANPGIDLLVTADWFNAAGYGGEGNEITPILTGLSDFTPRSGSSSELNAALELNAASSSPRAGDARDAGAGTGPGGAEGRGTLAFDLGRNLLLLLGICLLTILIITLTMTVRKHGKET